MKSKIGLFFGSFNPPHNGHLEIAKLSLDYVDQVHFIISPHNPFKDPSMLLDQEHRYNMVKLLPDFDHQLVQRLIPNDIEFSMSRPSYTYRTLENLVSQNNNVEYYLIFGSDCINSIHTWEKGDWILSNFPIIGFERNEESINFDTYKKITSNVNISSTLIRGRICNNQDISDLMPESVCDYIRYNGLWK